MRTALIHAVPITSSTPVSRTVKEDGVCCCSPGIVTHVACEMTPDPSGTLIKSAKLNASVKTLMAESGSRYDRPGYISDGGISHESAVEPQRNTFASCVIMK